MVWMHKKNRRGDSRSITTFGETGSTSRQIRSCLKVGPDDKVFVGENKTRPQESGNNSNARDHSNRSARSILSVISGSVSSRSRDTPLSADRARSIGSVASVDSAISTKHSTEKSSQKSPIVVTVPAEDKAVRFGNVMVREHDRAVGDNPSCSTGPPIGIGWGHTETLCMTLEDFEEKRPNRRKKDFVLTRAEREELLLNWGFPFDEIIDAIRANIKVKNQRRQTITNLRVERLEEAFENAARRIKRALLLRSSTAEKVKRLQEQAKVAAKTAPSPSSSVSDEQKVIEIPPGQRQQANFDREEEKSQNQVTLPEFRKKVPSESRLVRSTSTLSDFDDLHTSISGFTLENSTTASVREIERFYFELEVEMFGDLPLRDMVGETLEVPGLTIPEEERVYHDPPCSSSFQEPPSITPSYAKNLDYRRKYEDRGSPQQYSQELTPTTPLHLDLNQHFSNERIDVDSTCGQERFDYLADSDRVSLSSQMPIPSWGCIFHDDPIMAIRMGNAAHPNLSYVGPGNSSGLEQVEQQRVNMVRAYLSHTVTAMEQRYLHPSLAPPPPRTDLFGIPIVSSGGNSIHSSGSSSGSSRSSKDGRSKSLSSNRRNDGPVICYCPPFTQRSPTHWIEGHDENDGQGFQFPLAEPITISEDFGYDDRICPSSSASAPVEPHAHFPMYMAPLRFPPGNLYP